MIISKTYTFEASHQIPNHPGKCKNLHGHSYTLTIYVEGLVSRDTGMVLDYYEIDNLVKPVVDAADHAYLRAGNETQLVSDAQNQKFYDMTDQPYTTAECIVYHLLQVIGDEFVKLRNDRLVKLGIEVHETAKTSAYDERMLY